VKNQKHLKLRELLPWYLAGTLSEDEKAQVAKHLQDCHDCRKEFEEIQNLGDAADHYGDVLFTKHIASDKLVLFAEAPRSLDAPERKNIEAHLSECTNCREELKLLQGLESTLTQDKAPVKKKENSDWLSNFFLNLKNTLFPVVLKPAFAYFLVLLLAYPAWQGLQKPGTAEMQSASSGQEVTTAKTQSAGPGQEDTTPNPFFIQQVLSLQAGDTRGGEEENELSLYDSNEELALIFMVEITAEPNIRYDLEIFSDAGVSVIKDENIKSMRGHGVFHLNLPPGFLDPGAYTLKVYEIDTQTGRLMDTYSFSFNLHNAKSAS